MHETPGAPRPAGTLIGRPMKRREDLRFIQGRARYVDDITLPGMARLVAVHSPHAHARIRGIRADAARRVPGVLAIVTAADLGGISLSVNPLKDAYVAPVPHPILASGRVRYAGEPVVAVLGESLASAVDAAALVDVDYEALPAVADPRDALRAAVLLHDNLQDNVLFRFVRGSGDVDAAFRAAAHVVPARLHIPRIVPAPMEPRGAVAAYDRAADRLTVWISAQEPYRPRAQLSRILGRPEGCIRVVVPDVGGAFGTKGALAPEVVLAARLAVETGRPVKWIEQRRDNFMASTHGRGFDAELEAAVDADGRLVALRGTVLADAGAYLYPATAMPASRVGELLTGVYAIPAARVEIIGVATNKVPTSPYRGAGRPDAAYMIERLVDLVARELAVDPVALRRRNLIPPDRFPYRSALGSLYDSGDYGRALDTACAIVGYEERRAEQRRARAAGRLVGLGVCAYVEPAGGQLWESAAVSVRPDGRVVVRTGSTAHGQGHDTTFGQIAADTLGLPLEMIEVQQGDTDLLDRGVGTFGSRSITVGGAALVGELEKVKAKMRRVAGHLLEVAEADVQWEPGRLSVRGAPGRAVTFHDVAAAAHRADRVPPGMEPGLEAAGIFTLPDMVYPFGAYAAVVEVERDTGRVRVLKFVAVDDAGRIINPLLAEGQVIGGIMQGLGQALVEEVVYDETGQLVTGTFADYATLRAPSAPSITAEFTETLSPYTTLGAKGVGEAGTVGAPAALANAVIDALAPLGVRHVDLPLNEETLWRVIRRSR